MLLLQGVRSKTLTRQQETFQSRQNYNKNKCYLSQTLPKLINLGLPQRYIITPTPPSIMLVSSG